MDDRSVFGSQSVLHTTAGVVRPEPFDRHPIVNNYVYEGFVLALFALLCYIAYAYRSSIAKLFKEGFRDKIFDEHPLVFRQFMVYGSLMALVLSSAMAVKFTDHFDLMAEALDPLPVWMLSLLTPACMILLTIYMVYRRFLSRIIGKVVLRETFFERYMFLSRLSMLVFSFAVAPLFILFSMAESEGFRWIAWAILAIVALAYAIYLARSYYFFSARDVSILQWFLYLCAVEFLPLSFVLIASFRYS